MADAHGDRPSTVGDPAVGDRRHLPRHVRTERGRRVRLVGEERSLGGVVDGVVIGEVGLAGVQRLEILARVHGQRSAVALARQDLAGGTLAGLERQGPPACGRRPRRGCTTATATAAAAAATSAAAVSPRIVSRTFSTPAFISRLGCRADAGTATATLEPTQTSRNLLKSLIAVDGRRPAGLARLLCPEPAGARVGHGG